MIRRLLPLLLLSGPVLAQPAAPPTLKSVSCIDGDQIQGREGESDRTILFRMSGGVTYRNTLRGACPGLAEVGGFRFLATEQQGTRLCQGDFVRAVDPVGARATGIRSYAACPLGDFTMVPVEAKRTHR